MINLTILAIIAMGTLLKGIGLVMITFTVVGLIARKIRQVNRMEIASNYLGQDDFEAHPSPNDSFHTDNGKTNIEDAISFVERERQEQSQIKQVTAIVNAVKEYNTNNDLLHQNNLNDNKGLQAEEFPVWVEPDKSINKDEINSNESIYLLLLKTNKSAIVNNLIEQGMSHKAANHKVVKTISDYNLVWNNSKRHYQLK